MNSEKTIEVIEQMKIGKIGENKTWRRILKKINKEELLNPEELEYYTTLTRIYKKGNLTSRSKIYHTKLSEQDEKPPCNTCGDESLYYCNMNDQYFCTIHIVGHDKNEF